MRPAGHLSIGPVRFELRTPDQAEVRYSAPAYAGFFSTSGAVAGLAPLLEMQVEISARAAAIPTRPPVWSGGKNWAIWEDGSELICCAGFHDREKARYRCRLARDLRSAALAVDPQFYPAEYLESPLTYPLDQILSWGLLSRLGGTVMHAAVAVRAGVGLVFTGRSGAGKSTISALCHAAGWRILNDDRVMIYRRNDAWRVAGTPWHGSGRFAEADDIPLGGIYFLQQAPEDRMETMTASESRLALLDVAGVPWFENSWSQGVLEGLAKLVRDVEMRRLKFTKSETAVKVVADDQESVRAGKCA